MSRPTGRIFIGWMGADAMMCTDPKSELVGGKNVKAAWEASDAQDFAIDLAGHTERVPGKGLLVLENHRAMYDPDGEATAQPVGVCRQTSQTILFLTRPFRRSDS